MPEEVILIAAVTVDGFIARHKEEVTAWSQDLSLFKEQTLGHSVIMGFNTFKTLSQELKGRETIVVKRGEDPASLLNAIKGSRCFIIGGGKTFSLFAKYLTHLYVTPHPHIFGSGVTLFDGTVDEILLKFNNLITVDDKAGIFQYQYRVIQK